MAIVDPSGPTGSLRGKLGGIIYARQPDGTITARSAGSRSAEPTEAVLKGQRRMKLAQLYVRGVMSDPTLSAVYAQEAQARKMRTCNFITADFLTNPVIAHVDTTRFDGLPGSILLAVTGDDFKVIQVSIVVRDITGLKLQQGFAVPADLSSAKLWIYSADASLAPRQALRLEVTASDRAGHSTLVTISHAI